jgi:6-phosphogluconolactonase
MELSPNQRTFVYVSSAADAQIHVYELTHEGQLNPLQIQPTTHMAAPMATNHKKKYLYIATRAKPYRVLVYTIDPHSGELREHSSAELQESFPFICLDQRGEYLFGVSYGGSLLSINPIRSDGSVDSYPSQLLYPGRNLHSIRIDVTNQFILVPALGDDCVLQFKFDAQSGLLSPNMPPDCKLSKGSGPRHFVFSKDQRFVFVLNELTGTIDTLEFNSNNGQLRNLSKISILPPSSHLTPGLPRHTAAFKDCDSSTVDRFIWAADLQITHDGRFLYASERTGSTLNALQVNLETGRLKPIDYTKTLRQPRGFAIDPSDRFLIATGELSDQVACYAINPVSGELKFVSAQHCGALCSWVEIVQC